MIRVGLVLVLVAACAGRELQLGPGELAGAGGELGAGGEQLVGLGGAGAGGELGAGGDLGRVVCEACSASGFPDRVSVCLPPGCDAGAGACELCVAGDCVTCR